MEPINIKKTALSGFIWQMIEKVGVNGVQFLIYIILARLLEPKDFGIIALTTVFIAVSELLVNSGLGTALVQSETVDEADYTSVLTVSFLIASILYLVLFLAAPLIATYYGEPIIVLVLRINTLTIIFGAINGVQRSILLREMKFRKIFLANTIPVLVSGVIGSIMAFLGFGV